MQAKIKKKILYVITKSNFGGAQRYVYDMATSLPKDEHDVLVACGGRGDLCAKLNTAGIKTITIPHLTRNVRMFNDLRVFHSLLKIYRQERPDIVHLNSTKIGGLGAVAGRFAGVPKILFTAHGWVYKEDRRWVLKKITYFLSWVTVLFSHNTVVVSQNDYDLAPRLWVTNKIKKVYNGIDAFTPEEKERARDILLKKISSDTLSKNTIWLGSISELHKNKGLVYAINAIRELVKRGHDIVFFIIGEGDERKMLEQSIKENKIEKKVFLVGNIPNASLTLSAFDIFTLTSIKEGLPYTILEAGNVALPTVASHTGGIPEIVEDMESGMLVMPKDEKGLVVALEHLIKNKKKRFELGKSLKKQVTRYFTKDKMIKETFGMYK